MPPHSSVTAPFHTSHHASHRSLEVWTVWVLIATIVLGLLVVTPLWPVSMVVTKTFVLAIGTLLVLALYILARLSRGNIILPPMALVGLFWLPAIAYTFSGLFSGVAFGNAFWGSVLEPDTLAFVLVATCLGTLTAVSIRQSEHYRLYLRVSVVVFVLIAVLQAVVVVVGQFAPNVISPSFSILGSFEDLAFVLGLAVISTLVTLRFREPGLRTRQLLVASTIIALVLLALANSPFTWTLVGLVSFGLFVETMLMHRPRVDDTELDEVVVLNEMPLETEDAGHPIALPLLVLAVALFFLIGNTLGNSFANALHVNAFSVSPNVQSTFAIAQKTYATSPVFGTGPGTFGIDWLKYRDSAFNATIFWNTDFSSGIGFIPTSFVTTGTLGIIAWVLFLGLFVLLGIRGLVLRTPQDSFIRYVAILSFVASAYLFAAALFRSPNAVVLALAFVSAGLFASTLRYSAQSQQWGVIFSRSPRLGFIIVFSLTLLLLGSVAAGYALVERYIAVAELARANVAFASGDLPVADQAVRNAISFAPSLPAPYQAEGNIAIVRLGQIAASTTMSTTIAQQAFQATLSDGINNVLTATRLAPSDYQNWLTLGNLYAQAVPLSVPEAYVSAKAAYEKALALNPTSPEIRYIMARLDVAHKDIKSAETNLQAAIALKPDFINAIFLLSQLEVQDGNVKDALASALSASYFAPNDPNILFQVGVLQAAAGDLAAANATLTSVVTLSPQFANARYFLAAVQAKQGDLASALTQLQAISDLSDENARAVASFIVTLQKGKNPFPTNLLSAPSSPVK